MRANVGKTEGRETILGPGKASLEPAQGAAAPDGVASDVGRDQARSRSWKRTSATSSATAE